MVVRYLIALLAVAAALTILPQASAGLAPYEQMEFTEIVSDSADFPANAFADVLSLAVGEPGDESVIFRYEPAGLADEAGEASAHLWFDAPAGSFRTGINSDGTPGSTNPPDACEIVDPYVYCQMSYATLGGGVGSTIAGMHLISYIGVAQDYAPGLLYVPDGLVGGNGDDYTLVGSTLVAVDEEIPDVGETTNDTTEEAYEVYEETIEGETAEIDLAIDEPSEDVYVYYWTNELEAATLSGDLAVTGGSVILYIEDGEGNVLLEEDFAGDVSLNESFDAVTPGEWVIGLEMYGFTGSADLTFAAPEAEDDAVDAPEDEGDSEEPAEGHDGESAAPAEANAESPGLGLVALLGGIAAVAVLRRR